MLLSLINNVLEMARIESGKAALKTEVGNLKRLTDTIQAAFEPAVAQKGLQFSCTLHVEHEYVLCDKIKLREILMNIVSNAIKYTPEGGSITRGYHGDGGRKTGLRVLPDHGSGYRHWHE